MGSVQSRLVQIGHEPSHGRGRIVQPKLAAPSMIEPLLCGIVLGLIPVTLLGLFVAAWNQYRRGSALGG